MTMVIGRRSKPSLPHSRSAFCLAAGFVFIFILAYMTSFKHVQFVRNVLYVSKHSHPGGNGADEHRAFKTDSEYTGKPHYSPIYKPRLNCKGINTTSELLSTVPIKFLSNCKNPCWYEPLVIADGYADSKYYIKNSYDLTEQWKKRLKNHPAPKRLRCLPYFFIAGHPKCGTTDLYQKLTSHPDVVRPERKEPHWWTKRRFAGRSNEEESKRVPFQDYLNLFDNAALLMEGLEKSNFSGQKENLLQLITGDASASTLWFNDNWWHLEENCGQTEPKYITADYVRHLLPDSKIIVILRNPTERLYSDYLYFQSLNKSPGDFHKEVLLAMYSLRRCLSTSTMRSCIYNGTIANYSRVRLRLGMYNVFLEDWLSVFPRQQFLVLRLEDYALQGLDTLKTVFRFLGLRALTTDEEDRIFKKRAIANVRKTKDRKLGAMRADTRELLDSFYRPFNQKLSDLLHDSKYLWSST